MTPAGKGSTSTRFLPFLVLAVAIGVVLALFAPTLSYGFLGWDDRLNILENPSVIGGSVVPAWTSPWFGMYNPVVQTFWRVAYDLGVGSPVPFRVLNLLLHVLNGLLVYALSMRLLRDDDTSTGGGESVVSVQAALAATIFLLHPLQVGAVAWISGGRDLIATAFALVALLLLRPVVARSRVSVIATTIVATACFAASMLSKPSAAALPAVLLVLAATPSAAPYIARRRALLLAGAWSAVVAIVAVITYVVQADLTPMNIPIRQRLLGAIDAIGFYVTKVLVPAGLTVDYGRTPAAVWSGALSPSRTFAASVGVLSLGALVYMIARLRKVRVTLLLGSAGLLLLPVLGLMPFSYQRISTVADHYLYLPMAFIGMAAASLLRVRAGGRAMPRWAFAAAGGAVVVAAIVVTPSRVGVWESDRHLFVDALSKNPRSVPALISVAKEACDGGSLQEGIEYAERAVALDATRATAYSNLAHCLFSAGQPERVIALMPMLTDAKLIHDLERDNDPASSLLNSLAGSHFVTNRPKAGWLLLCYALALRPDNEMLQENVRDVAPAVAAAGGSPVCGRTVGIANLLESVEEIDAVGELR